MGQTQLNIKNLALKGGGVKGIAYVGAIRVLEKEHIYEEIERVSGTSAGALVAGMIAVGFSADKIEELMHGLDFKMFKGGWNPLRIFSKYGLYNGDYILNFIHDFFSKSNKGLEPDATFTDFKNAGCKDLIVFASDLNLHTIAEFSYHETPDCIVAEAIRASMSIPLFFKAWRFSNGIPNDHLYVDGGLVYNYPLSFFDKPRFQNNNIGRNEESLGLFLESKEHYNVHDNQPEELVKGKEIRSSKVKKIFNYKLPNGRIKSYVKHAFETLLNAQNIDFMEESHLTERTIFISDLGISATDFDLRRTDMDRLVTSGSDGAKKHIEWLNKRQNQDK